LRNPEVKKTKQSSNKLIIFPFYLPSLKTQICVDWKRRPHVEMSIQKIVPNITEDCIVEEEEILPDALQKYMEISYTCYELLLRYG
jgi:hypothetical protein